MRKGSQDDEPYGDYPRIERIIERGSNGYGRLKDVVFTAVILAAGAVIWAQQSTLNEIQKDVAVLKVKCNEQPVWRGGR